MKLYKLTDANGCTLGGTQWGPGVTHTAQGREGQPLCSDGWIHAYESPDLAILLNPIHANFPNPRLWEAEGEIGANDKGLKCGCRALTTVREIDVPVWATNQRVAFAIGCALRVYKNPAFVTWAESWLDGTDRSSANAANAANAATATAAYAANAANAAYAAYVAATNAANAAATNADAADAADVAANAAYVANAAANAAYVANAAAAAYAVAYVAAAAANAAYVANAAAAYAANATLDFAEITEAARGVK